VGNIVCEITGFDIFVQKCTCLPVVHSCAQTLGYEIVHLKMELHSKLKMQGSMETDFPKGCLNVQTNGSGTGIWSPNNFCKSLDILFDLFVL
jgi:hypothetical protein